MAQKFTDLAFCLKNFKFLAWALVWAANPGARLGSLHPWWWQGVDPLGHAVGYLL